MYFCFIYEHFYIVLLYLFNQKLLFFEVQFTAAYHTIDFEQYKNEVCSLF